MTRAVLCCGMAAACLLGSELPAAAQTWTLDLVAGRTSYGPIATGVAAASLIATLRYGAPGTWGYLSGGAPLDAGNPAWAALGLGRRFDGRIATRVRAGLDLAVHGYGFRDPVPDEIGAGAVFAVTPFIRLGPEHAAGAPALELRAGWQQHHAHLAGVTDTRGVLDALARVTVGSTVRAHGDLRWVHAVEGGYPFVGAGAEWTAASGRVWGRAGRWLGDAPDDATWVAGAGVTVPGPMELWVEARHDGREPLYLNVPRRTWSIGLTRRLGGSDVLALAPVARDGRIVVRLPVASSPAGAPSVAGDFSDWRPIPMRRADGHWEADLVLSAGVYRYAFVAASGEWFVPAGTPGRIDDGMGGHVALLVVP